MTSDLQANAHLWLPEFRLAIEAVGKALRGQKPSPELLYSVRDEFADVIPGHKVTIESWRKTSRRSAGHVLWITGERIAGSWRFTNSQLLEAVNSVIPSAARDP